MGKDRDEMNRLVDYGQRFLRQVYFHIKAAARSVGLPVLSVFAEKLQNPTHLMSTCLG